MLAALLATPSLVRLRPLARPVVTGRTACLMSGTKPVLGDVCTVDWSVTLMDGSPLPEEQRVFDQGRVQLVVGGGGFLPALHTSVRDLDELGVSRDFKVSANDAFGEPDPQMGPVSFPAEGVPPGLSAGDLVRLFTGLKARVTAVSPVDGAVTIDANHPLAGKDLLLKVALGTLPQPAKDVLETACFAGGCFWGLELAFQREPGVVATEVGYAQGSQLEPTYREVCAGTTGHTEAVQVRFDPTATSYTRLCELFWERLGDDRYKLNQVGNDSGTQYRHGVYTYSPQQESTALAFLEAAKVAADDKQVHTEVLPADLKGPARFWPAEEYHMQYLQKGGQSAQKTATETIRCYE